MKNSALGIPQQAMVVDCHLDIGLALENAHARGEVGTLVRDFLPAFRAGCVDVVFAACYAETQYLPEQGLRRILDQISLIYREVAASEGAFVIAKTVREIKKAKENGQIALLLALEGAEPLNGDVLLLHSLYALGVRVISPCWSRSGWAADGCRFVPFADYEGYGLTEAGGQLMACAEELGILIDVSHCNLKSFWDIVRMTRKPFIATHSNAYAVSPVARNLDDEQIKTMRTRKCVMGLNGANLIVNFQSPKSANLDDLVRHLKHEKQVGGTDILAIGLDQISRIDVSNPPGIAGAIFDVIPSHDQLPKLAEALRTSGFSEYEVTGIFGANVMRLLEATIG